MEHGRQSVIPALDHGGRILDSVLTLREMVSVAELEQLGIPKHVIRMLVKTFYATPERSEGILRTKGHVADPAEFDVERVLSSLAAYMDRPVGELRVMIVQLRS